MLLGHFPLVQTSYPVIFLHPKPKFADDALSFWNTFRHILTSCAIICRHDEFEMGVECFIEPEDELVPAIDAKSLGSLFERRV